MIGTWEIRPRDCAFAGLIMVAAAAMYLLPWSGTGSDCTTRLIETRSALTASDREISTLSAHDQATKCAAYRKRAEILSRAAPIAQACGAPQATRGAARPQFDSELSFYTKLVNEQCG
jgi:hypothetical protein